MKMLSGLRPSVAKKRVALAVMVLWIFTSQYVFEELTTTPLEGTYFPSHIGLAVSLLLYPFFGWLADTFYGRYKVIKISLYILWMISVLYCLLLVILETLFAYGKLEDLKKTQKKLRLAWCIASGLGLGGLLANIVQFGIDQLQDGCSSEIVLFFRWSGLAWLICNPLNKLLKSCLVGDYELVNALVVPALLSLVLSLDYVFSSWLVKEPVSKNPVVTIFKVLKFAWKNKYPRLRSAYSYWNTSFCARIDLAKSEYGGPFAAVDVEDTKAFWRIISLMICASFFASFLFYIKYSDDFKNGSSIDKKCSKQFILNLFIEYIAILILALFHLLLNCPAFSRLKYFINNILMLPRVVVGMVLFLLTIGGYGTLEVLGHLMSDSRDSLNFTCIFDVKNRNNAAFALDYKWTPIPNNVYLVSCYILMTTAAEFLCAQSPYSMKGLLFGLLFGLIGVFSVINYAWLLPFKAVIKSSPISFRLGCGFLYYFSILIILMVASACFICSCKFYRRRERIENGRDEKKLNADYFF